MIATDEDALVCDLAEFYNVMDYRSLPASRVATFSVGLRGNSRIKMKLTGIEHTSEEILLAGILDRLSNLVWLNSEDGSKGINRPKSILAEWLGEMDKGQVEAFDTPEDFEKTWNEIVGGLQKWN